jgi:hypothetical protein
MKTNFFATVVLVSAMSFVLNTTNSNADITIGTHPKKQTWEWGTASSVELGSEPNLENRLELYTYLGSWLANNSMDTTEGDATSNKWNNGLLANKSHIVAKADDGNIGRGGGDR